VRKGYVLVLLDVTDHELYAEYAAAATAIEARYGGRPLMVGDAEEVLEGGWPAERVVVLEFPSIDLARAWYADPEYELLIPSRQRATVSRLLLMEGFLDG
jgi:uncharacterized protein (DUF1330 family)